MERAQAESQHETERLHEDRHAHLRVAGAPLLEGYGHLEYPRSCKPRQKSRFDLEGVTAGVKSINIYRAQDRRPKGLVAARQVAIGHQQHRAGEEAAPSTDEAPQDVPARNLAAVHVARSQDE